MHSAVVAIIASLHMEDEASVVNLEACHLRAHADNLTGGFVTGDAPKVTLVVPSPR